MEEDLEELREKVKSLDQQISRVLARNRKVELNKAWEQSVFRKLIITILTYVLTSLIFFIIGVEENFKNALIPTLGFILSVQSVSFLKSWWVAKYLK